MQMCNMIMMMIMIGVKLYLVNLMKLTILLYFLFNETATNEMLLQKDIASPSMCHAASEDMHNTTDCL